MPKIAQYEYAAHPITKCLKWVDMIYEDGITRADVLATKLGHDNADSGAFRRKLTSLKRYGLITGRGDDFQLTTLGEKIASPKPGTDEREHALNTAVRNVALFDRLAQRLDNRRLEDKDWHHIAEIVGVDRRTAQSELKKLKRAYNSSTQYLVEEEMSESPGEEAKEEHEAEAEGVGPSPSFDESQFQTIDLREEGFIALPKEGQADAARKIIGIIKAMAGINGEGGRDGQDSE